MYLEGPRLAIGYCRSGGWGGAVGGTRWGGTFQIIFHPLANGTHQNNYSNSLASFHLLTWIKGKPAALSAQRGQQDTHPITHSTRRPAFGRRLRPERWAMLPSPPLLSSTDSPNCFPILPRLPFTWCVLGTVDGHLEPLCSVHSCSAEADG